MQGLSGCAHCAALVESTRQEILFVLLTGWGHTTAHTLCLLLKNKPEVQWEGGKEIRNGNEEIGEDMGNTRHYKSAPTSPQSHINTARWLQEESIQKNKRQVLATLLHAWNPAGFWACSWFHSNSVIRPGLSWWTRAMGMNARSSTVHSLGLSAVSKTLIYSAVQELNSA